MHDGEYSRVFRDMVLLTDAEKYASNEAQDLTSKTNISATIAKQDGIKSAETISTLVNPMVHEQEHVQAKKVNTSKAGIKKAGASLASVVAMQSHETSSAETKIDANSHITEDAYIDATEQKPKSTNGPKLVLPNGNTIDINLDGKKDEGMDSM